jgi:methylglutaconyl-CoA hydratase
LENRVQKEIVTVETDERGVATVTMNRPEKHNAFNETLVSGLNEAFGHLARNPFVRAVVLTGAGKSFSAGADLNWMQEMANYSMEANLADAGRLAEMLHTLDAMPQPTVAKINGGAYGGAVGLIGACDIAIAVEDAAFGVTEVRLGLIPSVISPYVLRAIGPRQARRYALTAERFDAAEALRIGLVHRVERKKTFDAAVNDTITRLVAGAPGAQEEVKALFRDIWELGRTGDAVRADTAQRIAKRRISDEAKEGMTAFLGKRKPNWREE